MKKFDLIHTTILIVAVLSAWSAVQSLIYMLSMFSFVVVRDIPVYQRISYDLISTLLFSATAVVLVKNARKYTTDLIRGESSDDPADLPGWKPERENLLLALLIGIGLYTLIQAIPNIVGDIVHYFRNKVGSRDLNGSKISESDFIIWLLKATIGAFLIYSAPTLTAFISKKATTGPDNKS